MRFYTMATAAAALMAASPALAQEETKPFTIAGSVTLVNDYRFRGVSQSDEELAVQGGISVTHESGFYVGTWGSNLAGWGTFGGSNTELDLYGGFKTEVVSGVTVDVGLTWYMYPGGSDKTDFAEPYVKVSTTPRSGLRTGRCRLRPEAGSTRQLVLHWRQGTDRHSRSAGATRPPMAMSGPISVRRSPTRESRSRHTSLFTR